MKNKRIQLGWPLGIRMQLTLWYTCVFTTLVLLFCIVFYTILQTMLASGVDTALKLRSQQIAADIWSEDGKMYMADATGELPGFDPNATEKWLSCLPGARADNASAAPPTFNLRTLVRVLNVHAQICYTSPAFLDLSPPVASDTQPLHGLPWQGTVTAINGQAVRLYSVPLTDNGIIFGVLQVGESLAQLTATLQSITIALVLIAPFVLLLSAFGSYWLAKRAFKPIHQLAWMARSIKARDLHKRVPVPRARDEVHDLAITLNEMIGRLNQAFTQQQRFVADASHELRTPVAVIRNVTDVALAQSLTTEEYVAVLQDVNAEAERLSHLINALLMLARADEDQLPLTYQPVRLDLLASDVVANFELQAFQRDIHLQIVKLEPAIVLGDMARLIQVLMGLMDNALTYTNAGGTITLSVEVSETRVMLTFRDTGIGIAEHDLPHIFERFYRADPARSRAAGGSGLGLAIIDWVVHAHEGWVNVESQLGKGSTFTVTLPLASATTTTATALKNTTMTSFYG